MFDPSGLRGVDEEPTGGELPWVKVSTIKKNGPLSRPFEIGKYLINNDRNRWFLGIISALAFLVIGDESGLWRIVPVKAQSSSVTTEGKPTDAKVLVKIVKMPIPEETALAEADKNLRQTYKTDFAKKKAEDKLALAAKLMQPGRENRKDLAAWFVLLREARDLAVQGNGPRLAIGTINEMDRWFIIDDPLEMKIKALTTISQAANDAAALAAAQTALALANRAIDDDNYETARRLIAVADTAVGRVRSNKKARQQVDTRKEVVEKYAKDFQAVKDAQAQLRVKPDDPELNQLVGYHLCLFLGRWEEGMPYLTKGTDPLMKSVAQKELDKPNSVDAQMTVADNWWDLAADQKGREQRNLRLRAKSWYERAGLKAEGGTKVKAVDRIKEVDDQESARMLRLLPGSYFGRGPDDRVLLLREGGGTLRSEQAVERGLEWLAQHQAPNGMWSNEAFQAVGNCNCGDPGQKFDIAGTAFGLLPFLGVGNTHSKGPYSKNVQRGLGFLLLNQKPDGNFSDNMYENALATIAFCEDYGLTRDNRLRLPAQAAISFIVRGQSEDGSWGYSPGAKGDTSVSGWQFSALKAGVYANLTVPKETFNRLSVFLDQVADSDGLGYGYKTPGNGRSTSAAGLLAREFLGWGPANPSLARGLDHLMVPDNFPSKDKISIYFIFYATQVMHHAGGKNWETWNSKVRDLLIDLQDAGDDVDHAHQKGSWSPKGDDYAAPGGRLMFTSLALLTLEVYYYHVPLYSYGQAAQMD